ncbi:MAG: hypothetical protein R2726_01960 [Acidimicrobiales bacterium]
MTSFAPLGPLADPPDGHPPPVVLDAYRSLGADDLTATAVEVHLHRCPVCRSAVNGGVRAERLADSWALITAELDAPRRSWFERMLGRVLPPDTVRLMLATPSLRRSWYVAVVVALLFGLSAANPRRPDATVVWFLALAPLIPVVGVALAYGRGVDPSYEVTVAAPMSGLRLVLVRSVAVLATSIAVTLVAALGLGRSPDGHLAAAWLLPAFALSALCLALSSFVAPRAAAWTVSVVWLAVVVGVSGQPDPLVLFRWWGQLAMLVLGAGAAVTVLVRRRAFDVVQGIR